MLPSLVQYHNLQHTWKKTGYSQMRTPVLLSAAGAHACRSSSSPNILFEFNSIRPAYSPTAASVTTAANFTWAHIHRRNPCVLCVPVFNLRHPRDFKSTTSRSRTLYIFYFGWLASVNDGVKKHDNQSTVFVFAANMAGRRVRPFVRDGEPYLHAWGVFRITYYSCAYGKAPTRQLHSIPIAISESGHTGNQLYAVIPMQEISSHTRFLAGFSSTFTRLAEHLTALRAWGKTFLSCRSKPNVLRPGIFGVLGSMVIRQQPCVTYTATTPHDGNSPHRLVSGSYT